jgi:tetratricopeptide (TPR) repeat protein
MEALQRNPGEARAYYLLGILTADHANHAKAIDLFDRALALDSQHAEVLAQKARSEMALLRREAAIRSADAAVMLSPEDAFTLDTLGVVYSRAGLHERALDFYRRATTTAPGIAAYQYNYGAAQQFVGQMDAARIAYRKCLELDPTDTRALAAIVQITKQTEDTNQIEDLEAVFPTVAGDADDALRIGHALAKAYEDLNRPPEAMDWLAKAKAAKWAAVQHDAAFDDAVFEAAKATAALPMTGGHPGAQPIFIVGMPRTGTTLVDRILSSHSAVTSAGELADFGISLKHLSGTRSNYVLDVETLEAAGQVDLAELGRMYLQRVEATLGLTGRFIDKLPLNAIYAPVILAALPEARVICLRRHPADTVLSNYRQLFATQFPYYDYALNLEATAHYYVGFDRMIRHFGETLPADRFTQVHYEDVVGDIEAQTRRLLEFCGLPFEAQCLDFHRNAAPVATASSAQVREPLYTSALARWKRYEADLGPALDILEAAGCITAAERGLS